MKQSKKDTGSWSKIVTSLWPWQNEHLATISLHYQAIHDLQERYQLAKDEYGTMTLTWSTNAAPERKQLPTERYFQRAAKQTWKKGFYGRSPRNPKDAYPKWSGDFYLSVYVPKAWLINIPYHFCGQSRFIKIILMDCTWLNIYCPCLRISFTSPRK